MSKTDPIFTPAYWRAALAEAKELRRLVLCAMFCALTVAVSSISIVVGENLYIYFTCYVNAVACAVCGPVLALLYGAAADTLNFILFTRTGYFPGYLLSECLGCLIYALFLYRRRISVTRLFATKFLVNYGVNVMLGSLWSAMIYSKGYLYYLLKSLLKNTILLPFEVILMAALFAVLLPAFSRFGLLPAMAEADRRKLQFGHVVLPVFGLDFLLCALASGYYGTAQENSRPFYIIAAVAAAASAACLIAGAIRAHSDRQKSA